MIPVKEYPAGARPDARYSDIRPIPSQKEQLLGRMSKELNKLFELKKKI